MTPPPPVLNLSTTYPCVVSNHRLLARHRRAIIQRAPISTSSCSYKPFVSLRFFDFSTSTPTTTLRTDLPLNLRSISTLFLPSPSFSPAQRPTPEA